MPRPARNYAPEELGLSPSQQAGQEIVHEALEHAFKSSKLQESTLAQQKVHHVVRTINKDNTFGQDGSIPMMEAENQLNQDWLSKGWTVLTAFLVGRNEGQFEMCWVLAQ
jgi:hypothetical protein